MSDTMENYINNLFAPTKSYLDNLKILIYSIDESETISNSDKEILTNAKQMLNNVISNLDTNKVNAQSAIQHIDSILQRIEHVEPVGGKIKRRKTRKNRRKRK